MITLYTKSESDFIHNGLSVLDNHIVSPIVTEELNGIYKLEFDYPIHAPHADELLLERIVRCPVPNSSSNSSSSGNSNGSSDTYDTADTNYQLFRIAEREASISGLLHIVAYHIFYDLSRNLIEDTNIIMKTGEQALAQILSATQYPHPFTSGSDIMETANARLVRKNPAEVLNDSKLENGFLSRWGGEIVRDNFYIAMRRVRGSDKGVSIRDKKNLTGYRADVDFSTVVTRIMPEGFNGLFLPEKYVDSPRIGDYNAPLIKVIKYDKVKAAIGEQAKDADALPIAEAYTTLRTLAAKEYSENHIDLLNATYQVEFAPLERTEEYRDFAVLESISLGDTVSVIHEADGMDITARMVSYRYNPLTKAYISVTLGNYSPRFTDVVKDIKRVEDGVNQAVSDANAALVSANGKNTNYYGPDTPKSPRIGDLWFRENGEITEIWIYEVRDGITQWFPLSLDLVDEQIRRELEAALAEVEAAKTAAANALAAGQNAQNTSEQATRDAADALNNSLVTALEAKTTAQTLETTVSQHASAISLNATNVANLNDRVTTSEASITVQAGLIASKASQISVDTLTGRVTTAESTIIQQAEMINLRVSKNDIINQINISTEGILISGEKVHITGQTTIDNAVVQTAMIRDVAITNAKIANLDAAKITTGSLSAERIAAGSITSDKLTIANGFIVNAMIADATISNAKIATLDAGKITTGTLSADRIAANSISSSKLVVADGFINTAMIANASITTAKIADLAVGTAKIADAAITDAKIANLSANKITTGTLDASVISVTNINASNITTGTLNCSKFNVTNLSASSISSGTLNASNVTITNLNASNITSGTLDASKITVTNININNVKYGDWPVITCTGTYGNPNIEFGNRQNSSSGYVNTLSIYGMTLTIGGRNISIGDTSAGSTVSITAASTITLMYSSSTYIQFNGYNKEFRPSGTGFYLGTSSYPWNYGYFTNLYATTFSPTSVTAQYITINGSSSTSSIYNSTINIGTSSYYVVFNSTQVRPCSSGMYLGTSSYPWNYGYFTELHATTFSPTSVSAQYITINGSSNTSSIYNSTVNIGTSSYYVVFNSTSVRPSTSGMYLGTSSYPWTYSYITNLYTTTSAQLGNSTSSRVGFFGSSGTSRQTVASVSTSGTLANAITGVNAIITALKSYGLIG